MIGSPSQLGQLQPTPTVFTMNDMRLFHHFLISAHPHIPVDHDVVWIREIPAFAHNYEYLMHSMLGLSASHLSLVTKESHSASALTHRHTAIKALNTAFSNWPLAPADAHAMLATCYALAFQSSYMEDSLSDHIISMRGCQLLSQIIMTNDLKGPFTVDLNLHCRTMEPRLQQVPSIDERLIRAAMSSLEQLEPLLQTIAVHDIETAFHAHLIATLKPLICSVSNTPALPASTQTGTSELSRLIPPASTPTPSLHPSPSSSAHPAIPFSDTPTTPSPANPVRAYASLMSLMSILTTWPQPAITHLLSPANPVSQVLLAHYIALQFILAPLRAHEGGPKTPMTGMLDWVERIGVGLEEKEGKWSEYVEWPVMLLRAIKGLVERNGGLTREDLVDVVVREPEVLLA